MKPLIRCPLVLAAALSTCLAAQAQTIPKRKPGLWEVQTQQNGQVGGQKMPSQAEMQAMMAQMPPAQRAQMEKMMREQGVGLTDRPGVTRYCLSKEMAEREFSLEQPDPQMKCEHRFSPVSSSEAKFSFTCTGPQGSAKGEGRGWNITPEGYRTSMTMQGTSNGQPMTMKMEQSAKWMGADCKGIKPMQ